MDVKLGSYVADFNLQIVPFEEREDADRWTSGPLYRIKQVFTTRDGSWEPSDKPGSIDQWAVNEWHSGRDWSGSGGTQNFFIKVLDKSGKPLAGKGLFFWQKGKSAAQATDTKTTGPDGCENLPVWNFYDPSKGETGGWSGTTVGRADVLTGVDLPGDWHVSTFAVLQETDAVIVPPVDPGDEAAFRAEVRAQAEVHDVLSINPHAALCRAGAAAGLWPTSNEYTYQSVVDGKSYTGQRFRNPANDTVTALYCVTGQWATVLRQDW